MYDDEATGQAGAAPRTPESFLDRLWFDELLLGASVVLAGIGIAVVNASTDRALAYWAWVAPLLAFTDGFLAWRHGSRETRADGVLGLIGRRVLHWSAFLLAMLLLFEMVESGRLASDGAGLVALVVLALTTFLAGIHGDPRLCVVGVLLGGIAAGIALLERFLWLLILPVAALLLLVGLARRRLT